MSIKKKLEQEIDEFNNYSYCNIVIRTTNILHFYEIFDYHTGEYCNFYYNKYLSYKENIKILITILERFFVDNGYVKVDNKYLRKSEIESVDDLINDENVVKKMLDTMNELYKRTKINNTKERNSLQSIIAYLELKLKEVK